MGLWGRNPEPSGSLWKDNTGPKPSARRAAAQSAVDYKKEQIREQERARERDEKRARRQSSGKYKHPAHEHPGGHKDPKHMTPREAKAHGLVVTRGLFGGISVQSRRSVISAVHDASEEAHGYGRAVKDLKRQMTKKGADRGALAKQITQAKAKQTAASRRAHKIGKML